MASRTLTAPPKRLSWTARTAQVLRVLRVIAGAEYKLKYSGSALGYVWSVVKPLALFSMLYAVFGHIFNLGAISQLLPALAADRDRPLHLLLRRDLDGHVVARRAASRCCASSASRGSSSRPRPRSPRRSRSASTASSSPASSRGTGSCRSPSGCSIVPLLLELYVFILGIALILSTLFVRLRDIGQVWELALQLMFYASPIIYPIGFLPRVPAQARLPQPVHAGAAGHPRGHPVPRPRAEPDHGRRSRSAASARTAAPDRDRARASSSFGLYFFRREEPWIAERV